MSDKETTLTEELNQEQSSAEASSNQASVDHEIPDSTYTDISELEKLRSETEELKNKWLRAQAEFENFRRRTRQEKEETAKYASKRLIEQLLPVFDNFDRALQSSKENQDFEALYKGVDMIFRQFSAILEQEGLKPMDVVGQSFNPEFHQAVMQVESEEHEEGMIVEEIQKGYMLKDKVIRPAMVKVSS